MSWPLQEHLSALVASYGYWLVAIVIALESMGLPLPGETTLIGASVYAGNTHQLSIELVIAAGVAGAVVGDNLGYWIGRTVGFRVLARHGGRFGLDAARLRLGRYLFFRHGGKVVFFGRFVAVLRALAALLAGAARMEWRRFLAFNAAGAVVWVASFSLAAYLVGNRIKHLVGPVGIAALLLAAAATAVGYVFVRRQQASLQRAADAQFPGFDEGRRR